MSADIQPGDVVVCVDDSPPRARCISKTTALRAGKAYRVTGAFKYPRKGSYLLIDGESPHVIAGYELPGGWDPLRFRKIEPAEDCFAKAVREFLPLETETT